MTEPTSPSGAAESDGTVPYTGWPESVVSKDAGTQSKKKKASVRGRRGSGHAASVSLTSLTDMVTMLLVYLLKTFATNPVEVKEPSIELPRSVCLPDEKLPADVRPPDGCGAVEETTIVMVTGPVITRTINNFQTKQAVTPRLVVDGKPVLDLDAATYRIQQKDTDPASGGYVITPLRDALKKAKEIKEVTAQITGKKFDGKVVILADKATPYRVLTEVLVTCGESGFDDFRFAVIKPDG